MRVGNLATMDGISMVNIPFLNMVIYFIDSYKVEVHFCQKFNQSNWTKHHPPNRTTDNEIDVKFKSKSHSNKILPIDWETNKQASSYRRQKYGNKLPETIEIAMIKTELIVKRTSNISIIFVCTNGMKIQN